jgi:hypothetical protein
MMRWWAYFCRSRLRDFPYRWRAILGTFVEMVRMFRKGNHTFTEKTLQIALPAGKSNRRSAAILCRLLSFYSPVGPNGQVAYLACLLWPRAFVPCRSAEPRDNGAEVRRRREHHPRPRSPVH